MMRTINRYFIRQLGMIFMLLLLILTGLAWMVQIVAMMKFLVNYGVELSSFLGLTAMMIPFIVSIILPFVTFITVLFVYNKMIGDNEVVVMASSGCSPAQIARPALFLAGILVAVHFVLNLWIVPMTQAKFYDTQWNLRYGLAHMKLQEGAFTEITHGLVVYVDKVSGHDLNQVMLSDMRDANSQVTIFAKTGKLVTTMRGLSIVMTDGSLHAINNGNVIGTFDTFDMDLSIAEKNNDTAFKARCMSTGALFKSLQTELGPKQYKTVMSELCNRLYAPLMNFILVAICLAVLLRSSLLRRRTSFAPAISVLCMGGVMAVFMTLSNMLTGIVDFWLLGGGIVLLMCITMVILFRK
ncbi:MAG: LptF/LptG family permease [Alphaproteobacteria bacterium]|nr:LptF/LptG family permease [Alphaproteobacteria bacterium]